MVANQQLILQLHYHSLFIKMNMIRQAQQSSFEQMQQKVCIYIISYEIVLIQTLWILKQNVQLEEENKELRSELQVMKDQPMAIKQVFISGQLPCFVKNVIVYYCYLCMYRIASYLHGVQLLQIPSMYHEPVIFTDVLLTT